MPHQGARSRARDDVDVTVTVYTVPPAVGRLTFARVCPRFVEFDLAPSRRNLHALFHHVWGHARVGEYFKDEWNALRQLLDRVE